MKCLRNLTIKWSYKFHRNCSMKNRKMNTSLRSVQAVRRNKCFIVVTKADHMIKITLQKPDFVNINEV